LTEPVGTFTVVGTIAVCDRTEVLLVWKPPSPTPSLISPSPVNARLTDGAD